MSIWCLNLFDLILMSWSWKIKVKKSLNRWQYFYLKSFVWSGRGLHSFFLPAPKMYHFFWTTLDAWTLVRQTAKPVLTPAPTLESSPHLKLPMLNQAVSDNWKQIKSTCQGPESSFFYSKFASLCLFVIVNVYFKIG
jgi:hypothetical protein